MRAPALEVKRPTRNEELADGLLRGPNGHALAPHAKGPTVPPIVTTVRRCALRFRRAGLARDGVEHELRNKPALS